MGCRGSEVRIFSPRPLQRRNGEGRKDLLRFFVRFHSDKVPARSICDSAFWIERGLSAIVFLNQPHTTSHNIYSPLISMPCVYIFPIPVCLRSLVRHLATLSDVSRSVNWRGVPARSVRFALSARPPVRHHLTSGLPACNMARLGG